MRKQQLVNGELTILFHVNGKIYAPVMTEEQLDAVKLLSATATDQLIEVDEFKIKLKESKEKK